MSLPVRALSVAAAVAAMAVTGLALPTSSATVLPTANTTVLAGGCHCHDDHDGDSRSHNRVDHNRYDHNDEGDVGLIVLHDIL